MQAVGLTAERSAVLIAAFQVASEHELFPRVAKLMLRSRRFACNQFVKQYRVLQPPRDRLLFAAPISVTDCAYHTTPNTHHATTQASEPAQRAAVL